MLILALALALCLRNHLHSPANRRNCPRNKNVAKGRQYLQQVIAALGGQAYLNVRNIAMRRARSRDSEPPERSWDFAVPRYLAFAGQKPRRIFHQGRDTRLSGFLMGSDELLITHGGAMITVYQRKRRLDAR